MGSLCEKDIRISNICDSDKNLERVLFIGLADAAFDISFNFSLALFAMTGGVIQVSLERRAQSEASLRSNLYTRT
jgi:hypothetical protein